MSNRRRPGASRRHCHGASPLCAAPAAVIAALLSAQIACTGEPLDAGAGGTPDAGAVATPYEGFASYHPYDDVLGIHVACSPAASTDFDPKNFELMVTALQDHLFDQVGKAEVCRKCAVVTSLAQAGGNGGKVTVRIIDRTQDHTSNGGRRFLDLSKQAFSRIGDLDRGFIPVRFEIADCPAELQ
jgi:expansin (peptidoglycan-binding protein)